MIVRLACRAASILVALAALLGAPRVALAVVLASDSQAVNLSNPGTGVAWDNVARMSGGSCVYLGNRWVLTANHVSQTPIRLSDGRVFTPAVGTGITLNQPGGGQADLRMVRLSQDPGLPTLQIGSSSPAAGAQVTMIGAGVDRDSQQIGWRVTASGAGNDWASVPLPQANVSGYSLLNTQHMRWGMNQVLSGGPIYFNQGNSFVFATRFDEFGIPFEAQATTGDSGGGVFQLVNGTWQLAGIMDSVMPLPNQPSNTVVYGDTTYAIDLSLYRDQIMGLMNHAEPLWQNQVNYFDVDGSGKVNAHDVVVDISKLLLAPNQTLSGTPSAADPRYDVNGDLKITSQDVLLLVSALLNGTANPGPIAAPNSALFVPEPSSYLLSLPALAVLAAAAWRKRRAASRRRDGGVPENPAAGA